MGKCFDEDSCSQIIEAAIRRASAAFGGFVPTKLLEVLEEAVYADENGQAFSEHAAAQCPDQEARGHIDRQIERDAEAGKLDALASAALVEYHAGKAREICSITLPPISGSASVHF